MTTAKRSRMTTALSGLCEARCMSQTLPFELGDCAVLALGAHGCILPMFLVQTLRCKVDLEALGDRLPPIGKLRVAVRTHTLGT